MKVASAPLFALLVYFATHAASCELMSFSHVHFSAHLLT